jgi:hypothetical protein
MERQQYDEAAARRILEKASAMQLREQTSTFSHDHLEEMARELDISPEYLQRAEAEWLEEQPKPQPRQQEQPVLRPVTPPVLREERHRPHMPPFVPILFFIVVASVFFGGPGPFIWFLVPAFFWSFGCGWGNRDHRRNHFAHQPRESTKGRVVDF